MRAVEQVLLHWGLLFQGKRVVIHTVNRSVFHGLANGTIKGQSMPVLRRCLLLAAEYDIDIQTTWIPTKENALADALSRFDYDSIANLAPQPLFPTCSPRDFGFLTYSNRDSPQSRPIISGAA